MTTPTQELDEPAPFSEGQVANAPPRQSPDSISSRSGTAIVRGARRVGGLRQYTKFGSGPGYLPIGETFDQMPPGAYSVSAGDGDVWFEPLKVIADEIVSLSDSKSDEVLREVERFWQLKGLFSQYGLVHKRGFLLWGPPGSGKTSTVQRVMCTLIGMGGVVIVANDQYPAVLSTALKMFRDIEPERPAVVVLEDIDAVIATYGESATLSLLDGQSSIANVIFIATTNYPEKLDGRIVNRPSRFDRVIKIGMPSPQARKEYLLSRKLGLSDSDMAEWVDQSEGFSIAHLKELVVGVLCFGHELSSEVKRLRGMKRTPQSESTDNPTGFRKD